ncbi:relaxase/mobilization nuclease domain-containing protein [Paracoccus sp. MBLB3053]|uniref:Relaxase/mobilization nuclease domain-containing protein n=1 Tax=Paracoccus aurantius TaxID=3073814 RepID=A0ABU2HX26_9RHOB|nr:relaxase/mobilization nuclease domain-containing protein [Paracoccus sp. MBLB3053]MDS9469612.1 relaxase/mobilization nuclease domain-containing protein [Paracoccus sp. MBLB3053]
MARATDPILEELRLRYLRGGSTSARQRFTTRANNLWRLAQGSNAAVLKKIHNGGTHSRKQLGNQFDYLFSKASAIFGNMVEHDPERRTLSRAERKTIATDWEDAWTGDPKNGHTTHLLLSFPADVAPHRALQVAEIWAAEMFQSGMHVEDEWAYIAALHSDRSHPHVHIVLNNRGLENDTWFYMARGHAFDVITMKERMVEIAAEQGLFLDSASRIERGKLTYGPSRVELERALREGREVREMPLHGAAVRDALVQIRENVATLQLFASMARQSREAELAVKIEAVAQILSRGGIIQSTEDLMQAQDVQNRGDLGLYYDAWLDRVETGIRQLPQSEQGETRREFYAAASDVARELGDDRGAALMHRPAREALHRSQIDDRAITRDGTTREIGNDGIAEIRAQISDAAKSAGLDPAQIQDRMGQGAANAWQERDWVRRDIQAVAESRHLDLASEKDQGKAAGLVESFYAKAAELLDRALEPRREHDRMSRTLQTMAQALKQDGQVAFQSDDHAGRFAKDLRQRYGEDLMARLVKGDDRALALDIPDPAQRRDIARAIITAAEQHESMGMSLKQVQEAKMRLQDLGADENRRESDRSPSITREDRDRDRER